MEKWHAYGLPDDVTGKTVLDVGCWEGRALVQATRRGAERVMGVDMVVSDALRANVERYGFEFAQLDVFSERFLHVGEFDIVLCWGVLYHVEDVMSLLTRLRLVTKELLVLETAISRVAEDVPILRLWPDSEAHPSRWWTPNRQGLFGMMHLAGFSDITETHQRQAREDELYRLAVTAVPSDLPPSGKYAPRRPERMGLQGGNRGEAQRGRRSRGTPETTQ